MSSSDAGAGTAVPEPELVCPDPATTTVISGTVPVAGLRDFFDESFRTLPQVLTASSRSAR